VNHGYTNQTERHGNVVRKAYDGPDAAERAEAELLALTCLAGVFPVPQLIDAEPSAVTIAFIEGDHGQDLMDFGHARAVLRECGRVLRQLHALDPSLISPQAGDREVIQHGDFGPNNLLFDRRTASVAAVLDWEFCRVGPAVADIAWCEWIVRMHHPDAVGELAEFFDAYGTQPAWADRQAEMLRRCAWLERFSRRWDPNGQAMAIWQQRAEAVACWTE
jgi:aminoglycoside phosphotransferase (APT) family kinase protein